MFLNELSALVMLEPPTRQGLEYQLCISALDAAPLSVDNGLAAVADGQVAQISRLCAHCVAKAQHEDHRTLACVSVSRKKS